MRARGQHAPLAPLINVNGNEKADVIVFFPFVFGWKTE